MNILMVLTAHDKLGATDQQTGFGLEEFAAPGSHERLSQIPNGGHLEPAAMALMHEPSSNRFAVKLAHALEVAARGISRV